MIPHERSLVARLTDKPFALVGVNSDTAKNYAERSKELPVPWRSFRDKRAGKPAISDEWKVGGWPTLYLIDHRGVIRKRWLGAPPADALGKAVDELLAVAAADGKR